MDFDYLKQKRILLVDDEQELLDMVISILNEDGFQNIKTAKTALQYNRLHQDQSHGIYRHPRHGQLKTTQDNQPFF